MSKDGIDASLSDGNRLVNLFHRPFAKPIYYAAVTVLCFAINYAFSQLVLFYGLPVFLDSAGTMLAAVFGGYLPAIIVGFATNFVNSINDPITLYYGIISIAIAIAAVYLNKRKMFSNPLKAAGTVLIFALLGGGVGSVLTWMLYGFSFGSGISAPFAIALNNATPLGEFWSQFTADMLIDLLDKFITVALVFIVIKLVPANIAAILPVNTKDYDIKPRMLETGKRKKFKHMQSLRIRVVTIILITAGILTLAGVSIGFALYSSTMDERYVANGMGAARLVLKSIDGDKIKQYAETRAEDEDYAKIEADLTVIRESIADVKYLYIYDIEPDGCYVILDLDTPDLEGGNIGDFIPHEPPFTDMLDKLLNGEEIEPVISHGVYGWLLTVYSPIRSSDGECVAYAGIDIDMESVKSDRYIFVIRMISLMFTLSVLIVATALYYAQRNIVDPLNQLAAAADKFAYDSEENRRKNSERLLSLKINTGDEIENLYLAISKTTGDVGEYLRELDVKNNKVVKQALVIKQLQNNIIYSFATLAEYRDHTTGSHIKRTAAYVGAVARELAKSEKYGSALSEDMIESYVKSAPLHDIGKIRTADSILNKPGKLTPEEFEIIKTHTTAGRDILNEILEGIDEENELSEAAVMAYCHHEKWDGSGYPNGISGEAIPLCARIMAVADVFDALITKRSYKAAYSADTAVNIIIESSGSHFDPDVVDAFIAVRAEVESIAVKYADA